MKPSFLHSLSRTRRPLCAAASALLLLGTAVSVRAETMQQTVTNSAHILRSFESIPEKAIPRRVLRQARGIAIVDIIKGGFVISGRGGVGVVVARTSDGWSGPDAIATGGAGFGFQIGAEVTEFVLVLNTEDAVKAFSHGGNVSIGGDLSVAAGPVGRVAEGDVLPTAARLHLQPQQGALCRDFPGGNSSGDRGQKERRLLWPGRPRLLKF